MRSQVAPRELAVAEPGEERCLPEAQAAGERDLRPVVVQQFGLKAPGQRVEQVARGFVDGPAVESVEGASRAVDHLHALA